MKKAVLSAIIASIFVFCACENEDLSEFGGSALMKSAGRHPTELTSNQMIADAQKASQDYKEGKIERFVDPKTIPSPTPYKRVLTDEEKTDINRAYTDKLNEFYSAYDVDKTKYNVDSLLEKYDVDKLAEIERVFAQGIANEYGITADEVMDLYSGEFKSDYYRNIDRESVEQQMANDGLTLLQSRLEEIDKEIRDVYIDHDWEYNYYINDNTLYFDIHASDMELIFSTLYTFGTDKLDREELRKFTDGIRAVAQAITGKKNELGIKSGHVVTTLYDKNRPNEALLIFTDGDLTYNAFEDKDKIWK